MSPASELAARPSSLPTKIRSRIREIPGVLCWEWIGACDRSGYGRLAKASWSEAYAHRYVWIAYRGPIPPDLEVDHLCRNRACCNPAHLELVSHATNQARGQGWRLSNSKTCKQGHPWTKANTYWSKTRYRTCRRCRYEAVKRWNRAHPERVREWDRERKKREREKRA